MKRSLNGLSDKSDYGIDGMVQSLRRKFIICMMVLITTLGVISSVARYYHIQYWTDQETLDILKWYASDDGFAQFFDVSIEEGKEEESMDDMPNPIYSVRLDQNGQILEICSSARDLPVSITEDVIAHIFRLPGNRYKWDSYVYYMREDTSGYELLITDTSYPVPAIQVLGKCLLMAVSFVLLLLISFILSGFVTRPAQRAFQRERQFVADVSHELKTPLSAISVNAKVLQQEYTDHVHVAYILSEADRMNSLIQKMLQLSRIEELGNRQPMSEFSLSKCCEEISLSLEAVMHERGILFEFDITEGLNYYGNREEIRHLVEILLSNAMEHTPKEGTIRLSLFKQKRKIILSVTDTGEGIDPEDIPCIFDRFYRADPSRDFHSRNYGLGLSIAKAIADAHHAMISVTSSMGAGASFTVRF